MTDASSLHLYVHSLGMVVDRTNLLFDRFGSSLTDEHVVFSSNISNNGFVELVARDLCGARHDRSAQRKNGYVCGSTANVDNHIADRGIDVQPCANSSGNGLLDQISLLRARLTCSIENGFFFNLGDTRGNTDHNVGLEEKISASATNEILNHFEGDLILADNAVTQGSDRHDIAGGTAQHLLCLNAHLENAVGVGVDRHHRGLLQHNALALHVNENGCGAKVNAYVAAELKSLNKRFCALNNALARALFGVPCRALTNIGCGFLGLFRLFHKHYLPSLNGSSSLLYIIFRAKSIYFLKNINCR